MISGIQGAAGFSSAFRLISRAIDEPAKPDAALPAVAASPPAVAESGAAGGPLGLLAPQAIRVALGVRSRHSVITGEDGSIRERHSTRLRFRYDLRTEDGTHVELRVKAKVQQTRVQDENGDVTLKSRVKLQVSLVGEGVADELGSLLGGDGNPGAPAADSVGSALRSFLETVGELAEQFASGQSVDADELIQRTVEAFNDLIDGLAAALSPSSAIEGEVPVVPALAATEPVPASPLPPPIPVVPAAPSAADEPSLLPAAASVETANEPVPPEAEPTALPPVVELPPAESPPAESPPPAGPEQESATQVLQRVRLRFIQSITQVIKTLSPDDESIGSTTQHYRERHHLELRLSNRLSG